jgi:hypothetical protein
LSEGDLLVVKQIVPTKVAVEIGDAVQTRTISLNDEGVSG